MTRIMTNPELIKPGRRPHHKGQVWWSIREGPVVKLNPYIHASGLIPNGAIIKEVKIQAAASTDRFVAVISVFLGFVKSPDPTIPEMEAAETLIPWEARTGGKRWISIGNQINEAWLCHRVVPGAGMRFGVAMVSGDDLGVDCRVSVRYEVP